MAASRFDVLSSNYSQSQSSPTMSSSSPATTYSSTASSHHHHHHQSSSHQPMPQHYSNQPSTKVKLCCVGDGGVGKTCLLVVYSTNTFPEDYVPTVFENYVTRIQYNDKLVEFALWDTAGQEEYDRLRPLSYPETEVLLICFAVDVPASLDNVEDKWYPEVSHFLEGVPLILICTKTDLRTDRLALDLLRAQGRSPTTSEEGQAVARRIGATYAEVSAKEGRGVKEVFERALKEAMRTKGGGPAAFVKRRGLKCVVL